MVIPGREQFLAAAEQGNLIPVYREILADRLTPVSALERLTQGAGTFLLESVEGGERLGRYSFLGSEPFLTARFHGRTATLIEDGTERVVTLADGDDALTLMERLLARYRYVPMPGLPPFCGGAVGFLAYDMVRYFERIPADPTTQDDLHLDDACFLFTDTLLVFDHVRHRLKVVCNVRIEDDPNAAYDRALERIEAMITRLREVPPLPPPHDPIPMPPVTSNMTQAQYEIAVERCKEYIAAGDAFQVVPSQRFSAPLHVAPFEVYRALRSINPSPYMYFLDFGERQIVGSSPEILVTVEESHVTVRPIAGTRPRGETPEEDRLLAEELLADEKECAEHIMLIDLGRNDVGRVSEYGSVLVDELMGIERYSHVMHIVSNVSGRLASDKTIYDALRAAFPAGTLTGAPKVRAMEIIEELEPTRRGLYGGAVGYFSFNGDMDFAIAIRTMLVERGIAYIQAGAGVVADSVPENEYHETRSKARALLAAIELAHQGLE